MKMELYNDIDYDGVVVKLPNIIIDKNPEIKDALDVLKSALIKPKYFRGFPDLMKSFCEIDERERKSHYNQKKLEQKRELVNHWERLRSDRLNGKVKEYKEVKSLISIDSYVIIFNGNCYTSKDFCTKRSGMSVHGKQILNKYFENRTLDDFVGENKGIFKSWYDQGFYLKTENDIIVDRGYLKVRLWRKYLKKYYLNKSGDLMYQLID